MILPCTWVPDAIYANMKSAGSGRGLTAKLNSRANFGPPVPNCLADTSALVPNCLNLQRTFLLHYAIRF